MSQSELVTRPEPSYRLIPLTKGYRALVDECDYERVMQYKWNARIFRHPDGSVKVIYGGRQDYALGRRKPVFHALHRFILGVTDPKVQVDHIDHDGLNCRRENLRATTLLPNRWNRRKNFNNKSGYKGVGSLPDGNYRARISVLGKLIHLGVRNTAEEAARLYDAAAQEHFGEFACLNFPAA